MSQGLAGGSYESAVIGDRFRVGPRRAFGWLAK